MSVHTDNGKVLANQTGDDSKSSNETIAHLIDKNMHSSVHRTNYRRLRTVENFIVLWYDPRIDESQESTQRFISRLRQVVNSIKPFTNAEQCVAYLNEIKDENVFVIAPASVTRQFVFTIADKSQLASIYIFCTDEEDQPGWIRKCSKVKGVFEEIDELCNHLKSDVRQRENDFASFSIISSFSATNLNELDPSFMYSQLLKEILLEEKTTLQKKKEFVEFCRSHYKDNGRELAIIEEFEQKYPTPSLIWWYTRDCFLFLMLNKALRTQDVEIIMKMGFVLRDLHQHIEQVHAEQNVQEPLTVFRGQGMARAEFEKIKRSKGGLLAFNSFLSTTTRSDIAQGFVPTSRAPSDLVTILFCIQIDPKISTTPFADVSNVGFYKDREKEVLFSMHTVFRIGDTTELETGDYRVDLALTNDNDQQLAKLTEHMREVTQGPTGLHRMGQLMCHMGEFDKAKQIYTTLVEITPDQDRQQRALFYHQLGYISKQKDDLISALTHYQQSLDIKLTYLSSNDPQLSPTYSNIGSVLQDQGDLDGALEHLKHALNIALRAPKPDRLGIAIRYSNIGSVLEDQGDYHEALIHYERALELQLRQLPPRHPSVATTYNNIGLVNRKMGDNLAALKYYQKTLDIFEHSLPAHHLSLATCHHNMAQVLNDLHRTEKAIEHAKQAVEIAQHSYDIEHPNVQRRQAYLDELRRNLY